jgi:hypothetical protein
MARNSATRVQSSTQKLSGTRIQPSTPQRAPSYSVQYAQPLATEIVVDQQQSLELVRTVISAAVRLSFRPFLQLNPTDSISLDK